jgi:aldose 1-epimerase
VFWFWIYSGGVGKEYEHEYFQRGAKEMKTGCLAGFFVAAAVFCAGAMFTGCDDGAGSRGKPGAKEKGKMSIVKEPFGQADGKKVDLYTLTNKNGLRARIMTYGGILVSLEVPDRDGKLDDITLGFETLDEYVKGHPYFGAIVGRYGNRIGRGKFTIDGVEYTLAVNNGPNHLHGGVKGFDKVVWNAAEIEESEGVGVRLEYLSRDGEEGYPGNLSCVVTYVLTNKDELKISYEATTDKATVVNLTNHTYWNLAGQGTGDILGHEMMIAADRYTAVDEGLIPTGELPSVKGTPMDFTSAMSIGSRIGQVDIGGYDHNYVLNSGGGKMALCARVYEPGSGRVMEISTDQPGVQFYTGNFLDGSNKGKGKVYEKHYAFCLETQHFPDSPNKPEFPSVVLRPGQTYKSLTIHRFYSR